MSGFPDDSQAGGEDGATHQHIGDDVLNAYLDGALGERDQREVAAHLSECRECRRELAELRATANLLRGLPQYRPRRSFVMTPEEAPARRRGWAARLLPALPALQAAAVVVALLLIAVTAGDLVTHRQETSGPRLAALPIVTAALPAGTRSVPATSHVMQARAPAPASAKEANGAGTPTFVQSAAAAAPSPTPAAQTASPRPAKTGSSSLWRVGEVALGLLLLWLLVTIVGLRRMRGR